MPVERQASDLFDSKRGPLFLKRKNINDGKSFKVGAREVFPREGVDMYMYEAELYKDVVDDSMFI